MTTVALEKVVGAGEFNCQHFHLASQYNYEFVFLSWLHFAFSRADYCFASPCLVSVYDWLGSLLLFVGIDVNVFDLWFVLLYPHSGSQVVLWGLVCGFLHLGFDLATALGNYKY